MAACRSALTQSAGAPIILRLNLKSGPTQRSDEPRPPSIMNPIHASLSILALASAAGAQVVPVIVTDSSTDKIWRCADLTSDGDYLDAGEVVAIYTDTIGSLTLTNNVGVHSSPDGTVYVSDISEDSIFTFRDANGDGDADDAGEHVRYFDGRAGGNASGVLMPAANNLVFDTVNGAWFVASANSGAVGNDAILRLVDSNSDGDANDAGEAREYWTYPGSPGGDSLPQGVEIGLDGNVYFADAPSSGPNGKGVYRLVDLNADGDALDAGEVNAFFIPPFTATPFYWCLELGADGWFYTADTGNDVVWRFRDLNADGDAQDAGESSAWWTVGAVSNIWDLAAAADGSIYAADSMPVSRVWRLFDADANGVIGAGESTVIYDETLTGAVIGNPRGIDLAREIAVGTPYCFGDGSGTSCPCGNVGSSSTGCPNSIFANGGRLVATGSASIANDTLVLVGSEMPSSSALYFQGTSQANGGLGFVFGDGLRCAAGAVTRLGTKVNVVGTSTYPAVGDQSVSIRGVNAAGNSRTYQVWYRNAAPAFCTADTYNLTNAVSLTWTP